MSEDNTDFGLQDIMSNYWHSRGLMVAGMLLALYCPFPMILLPISLLVDLFYHNPVLPMNIGIKPQELMVTLVPWIRQQYVRFIELYKEFSPKDKQKKLE